MIIVSLDPGNTTGVTIYRDSELEFLETKDLDETYQLIVDTKPDVVVFEDYKIYPTKALDQSWSQVYPVQVIGVIKLVSILQGIPYVIQPTNIKKPIFTALKTQRGIDAYEYWTKETLNPKVLRGKSQHIKDSYVHLIYYLKNRV